MKYESTSGKETIESLQKQINQKKTEINQLKKQLEKDLNSSIQETSRRLENDFKDKSKIHQNLVQENLHFSKLSQERKKLIFDEMKQREEALQICSKLRHEISEQKKIVKEIKIKTKEDDSNLQRVHENCINLSLALRSKTKKCQK